jgi:hypothetical protein
MREVPVVSLDVDPDQILERENIGVHARSMDRLIASIREYVTGPAKRAEHGARARRYALSRHSLNNVRFLEQLIQSGRITPQSVSPTVSV